MCTSRRACRKCTVGVVESLISILHRRVQLEYCRKQGEKGVGPKEREKARKPVQLRICDNGQICDAFAMLCEESSGRERHTECEDNNHVL